MSCHVFKRRRDALEQPHSTFGAKHRVTARGLFDLADRLLDALNGRLGPPAEGMAPETRAELPFLGERYGFHASRLMLRISNVAKTAGVARRVRWIVGGA